MPAYYLYASRKSPSQHNEYTVTVLINQDAETKKCCHLQENVDKFLDLKRSAFCTITQRIQELVDSYRSTTGIDNLKTNYSARRGFGIQVPKGKRKQGGSAGFSQPAYSTSSDLGIPEDFEVLEIKTNYVLCTSQVV